ncbi:hypothetical protein GMDG_07845 [Pseudogymnoascus destructans 20631-21]|uniref:Uncharacterized protein n=1 Tax=Pseudogymnoascus destructans (strain ATCC MYA-4855 / 20631-21) TaxID=658429 RepID=L8FYV5_PSED2|nr:hypothetical protein GMDG_07845 [Pseudogymnoascus destructans 20631-21]
MAHSSNSSSSEALSSIPLASTSSRCPRCSDTLYFPPSIETLESVFPSVSPSSVNRSIPRCVQCDKVNAERAAYFAEFPPPTHVNPVAELERRILQITDLIASNVQVDRMRIALAVVIDQKGAKERERDAGIREAWKDFCGIWGPPRTIAIRRT